MREQLMSSKLKNACDDSLPRSRRGWRIQPRVSTLTAERQSLSPKSRAAIRPTSSMHKCLIGRHKQ
jgi:hypothetical protein